MPEVNFDDAPSGDLSLDDVFGEHPGQTTTTVTPQTTLTPVVATPSAEPVIKTNTGTVYKTLDDAKTGIEHKDALIGQLRDQVLKATGQDPLKPARRQEPEQIDYNRDQDRYFEDLASAVAKKDTKAYMNVQQKLIMDTLGPVAPTIAALSRANAERVVGEQLPEFRGFLGSDDYRNLEQQSPLLMDAIRQAEMNPSAGQQLPELYKVAYLASRGSRVPEIVQAAQHAAPAQVVPRPTVHSGQIAPPSTTSPAAAPSLQTREGRKALVAQYEQAGLQDKIW